MVARIGRRKERVSEPILIENKEIKFDAVEKSASLCNMPSTPSVHGVSFRDLGPGGERLAIRHASYVEKTRSPGKSNFFWNLRYPASNYQRVAPLVETT